MDYSRSEELLQISEEILKNIELNEIPLANILLKGARLARLINDQETLESFLKSSKFVSQIEEYISSAKIQIAAAVDPDVSISSSNPNQYVYPPKGNTDERTSLKKWITAYQAQLQEPKTNLYKYVLNINYQLRFSGIPNSIFENTRNFVDSKLKDMIPESIKKFVSIYDNLKSDNPEDWSNAVHSCRRVIQDIANSLYPPNKDGLNEVTIEGKKIKIGPDHYINRLMLYVTNNSRSEKFKQIVGAQLDYLGNRLDSIYEASNKGTHSIIEDRREAERYIIYTYLLLGDILELNS